MPGIVILVSGASGFIGRRLVARLIADGAVCRLLLRRPDHFFPHVVADLSDQESLLQACAQVNTVFHCAGYAHAFTSFSGAEVAKHWTVNFEGTRNLVEAAGRAGVKQFIFLSSVKAMGDPGEVCADETFSGEPETAYGQAKLAAERAVLDAGRRYGMHVVNLRLVMVYGAGAQGNLERMGRLIRRGLFPPLPETGNRRSLVHVDDVISAMRHVAHDIRANGKTYIVASPDAPSGRRLYDGLRWALALPACRWAVPESVLRWAGRVGDFFEACSKRRMPLDSEVVSRLLCSAYYSPQRIEVELGWRAKITLDQGLQEMFSKVQ